MASFDLDNAAVRFIGPWSFAFLNGQRVAQPVGLNAQLEFRANGTACTVRYAVEATGTNYMQASVDGGAFANLTGPGSTDTFTDVTVFTGLSAAEHSVVIRHNTGTQENVEFQIPNGITITGSVETIAAPSDAGELLNCRWDATKIAVHGLAVHNLSGNWPRVILTRQDAAIRILVDGASAIKIYAANNSAKARLYQDRSGTAVAAAVTLNSGNIWEWYTLASGLSGLHEYWIANCLNATELRIGQILVVGGTVLEPMWRPNIIGYGHSKVASNVTGALATTDLGWLWQLGVTHGYGVINQGMSARKIVAITSGELSHLHEDPPISYTRFELREVPYVFVNSGHNDSGLVNTNLTDFEWATTKWFIRIAKTHRYAKRIYVFGEFNVDSGFFSSTIRNNMNTAISNAVTAAMTATGQSNMTYINTDNWISPATDTSDGAHPNTTGTGKIITEINSRGLLPTYSPMKDNRRALFMGSQSAA